MEKYVALLRLVGLGWLFVISIGLGLLIGAWLDSRLQTTPLFILIGVTAGVITGFVAVVRLLTETVRVQQQADNRSRGRQEREHHREDTEE